MSSASAADALERLLEGNRRFIAGERRDTLVPTSSVQSPFAVILGCSDSRVPVEIVFDQGFGDLFVIRVAGNIVARSQIGTVEFAIQQFGTPLVVVLGHTGCGAVQATLDHLRDPRGTLTPSLRSIVDRISPAVSPHLSGDPEAREAVRANVRSSVVALQGAIGDRADVVGAKYDLETGVVTVL